MAEGIDPESKRETVMLLENRVLRRGTLGLLGILWVLQSSVFKVHAKTHQRSTVRMCNDPATLGIKVLLIQPGRELHWAEMIAESKGNREWEWGKVQL